MRKLICGLLPRGSRSMPLTEEVPTLMTLVQSMDCYPRICFSTHSVETKVVANRRSLAWASDSIPVASKPVLKCRFDDILSRCRNFFL